ncbi:SPOR domain-containing protein [Devosia sp. YIM 151766]|uniref:SPOR domain-containing protein n=1 Tax=Devosia sp. YIM 151766 TaxID=3017325 RepID=UPI00255CB397|nr:SPOR domain-containing protein [Devosia sp. YIM 151766]WIY54187.1 SPOR domain-containing protein [Devosia sp. YIM 151766]
MAAPNEAPDDLIAELARLMADDARTDQNVHTPPSTPPLTGDKPAPVRIPGGEASQATENSAAAIRIPGMPPAGQASPEAEPFNFDFAIGNAASRAAGPATPLPSAKPSVPAETPAAAEPPADGATLDYDGLADLIAAELANDLPPAEPVPVMPGPARGEDNFGVPPVFGLGAPAASQPAVETISEAVAIGPEPVIVAPEPETVPDEPVSAPVFSGISPTAEPDPSDPLSDIERLLGPVVPKAQNEAEIARAPSPALRSLATPTLPAAAPVEDGAAPAQQAEPGSVDDAILAAAAATGARVEWVDPAYDRPDAMAEDRADIAEEPRRRPALSRAVAGPLVAVGLLGIAGFGLYWVLGQDAAPSGPAPLVVADTATVKNVPEPAEASGHESVVFNEISGAGNAADEQIVPRDQSDEAALNEAISPSATGNVLTSDDGTSIDPNQDGLVNRKVRTVTVRPDGTIISGDESMAGGSILPVERPNVPEVPGADFSTPDLIASTIAAAEAATETVPEATSGPQAAPVASGATVPVADASGAVIQGRTVTVPVSRPDDFAQVAAAALAASAVPATTPLAVTAPQPAAAQPVATTTGDASAYVQLASQRNEEAARQSAQAMTTRFGVLFGGASPEIQRVDLGERGIYYRVLVPASSRDAAANICTNIKAAGGDCLLL